jgi:CRP-like cAMP-binding protein
MNVPVQASGQLTRLTPAATNAPVHLRHRNAALAALSSSAFSLLEPHLRYRDFEEGAVLWDAGEQVDRVYFPLSGIISIVLPVKDGCGIEAASVGQEGWAGIDYRLGQSQSVTQGITQIAGMFSYVSALQFVSAARQNDEIDHVAAICCNWVLAQSQQMAACNAVHPADARFCRWLLLSGERIESDVIPSTQEAIARALGIRRTTVTLIAQGLQTAGIISYRRGKIVIRDREGLRSAACDCCAALGRRNWPSVRLCATGVKPLEAQVLGA